VKKVAYGTTITSSGHGLFSFINIVDLRRPWAPKRGVWGRFFCIFCCNAHFNSKLRHNG